MKKILFVDPFCKNPKYESPNIKLAYGCAVVEKLGLESKIIDFIIPDIENLTDEEYSKLKDEFINDIVEKAVNYDFMYLNCEYGVLNTCVKISKKIINKCKTIVGGTYINYLYEGKLIGEGCKETDIFDYLSLGDIEKDIEYITQNNPSIQYVNAGIVEDLDEIPFPLWSKFNLSKYDGKLYLVASKGCSYNKCKFCDEQLIWGKKYRYRKPENIFEEIRNNVNNIGINEFFFWDASIAAYPNIKRLCNMIIDSNIKCSWTALTRVDELDDELIELMKKSGCKSIEIGIESLNNNTLKNINKGIEVNDINNAIKLLKKHEIMVEGSFLIGYPWETEDEMKNTIKKAVSMDIDYYRWHNFQPYAKYLKINRESINHSSWLKADVNFPNHLLYKHVKNEAELLDMHMVSKLGDTKLDKYPKIKIGNMFIEDIHRMCRYAIEETKSVVTKEGHNPYI